MPAHTTRPALAQLWVVVLVPLAGGVIAGLTYKPLFARTRVQGLLGRPVERALGG